MLVLYRDGVQLIYKDGGGCGTLYSQNGIDLIYLINCTVVVYNLWIFKLSSTWSGTLVEKNSCLCPSNALRVNLKTKTIWNPVA